MDLSLIVGLLFSITSYSTYSYFDTYLTNSVNYTSVFNYYYADTEITYCDNLSSLKVGNYTENNEDRIYEGILLCSFPSYDVDYISNATLTLTKYSGYAQNVSVDYCYDYSPLGNPSTVTWYNVGSLSLQGNTYSINLTNLLINSISNNQNKFYLRLYLQGSVNLGCESVHVSNDPKFQVKYSLLPSNGYGCATPYTQIYWYDWEEEDFDRLTDCYGYAIDACNNTYLNLLDIDYFRENSFDDNCNYVVNVSKNIFNVNVRRLIAYDSPIYDFERRIGLQYSVSGGFYHFIRQNDDGYWSSTNGTHNQTKRHMYLNPTDFDWGQPWGSSNHYDSTKVYFAITPLGGHSNYEVY